MSQVDEFSKDSYVHNLASIEGHGFLVTWKWVEMADEEDENECDAGYDANEDETLSTDSDLADEQAEEEVSTVTFKCIGVKRDQCYQDVLCVACELMKKGETVPVKLVPEPTNPVDSRAIAFQCQTHGKWNVIGYVVKEVCESLHDALVSDSITSTEFAWVKFKILRTTGPGYYAAVNVTRRGEWPTIVKQSANTMY